MAEPKKYCPYSKVYWPIHRPNVMLGNLNYGDYELDKSDKNYIKHFSVNSKEATKKAKGVSCFVPFDTPHNVPNEKLSNPNIPCYFIAENTDIPEGLVLIYTHKMKLRYPSATQSGYHFIIAPTVRMSRDEYIQVIRDLEWFPCDIKASAEMVELVSSDDDLDGVDDFQMAELYWLMEIWYKQATDVMDCIHAIDIHTWIALDKPSLQDLLQDNEYRAYIVFSALSRMKAITPVTNVTELMYQGDILGELEDAYGWRDDNFIEINSVLINQHQNQVMNHDQIINYHQIINHENEDQEINYEDEDQEINYENEDQEINYEDEGQEINYEDEDQEVNHEDEDQEINHENRVNQIDRIINRRRISNYSLRRQPNRQQQQQQSGRSSSNTPAMNSSSRSTLNRRISRRSSRTLNRVRIELSSISNGDTLSRISSISRISRISSINTRQSTVENPSIDNFFNGTNF
ncbi:hypothetical protein C1645_776161 [Glomus cerebriforme]|uniref:Uncharacterized protein n=1 Tax=Glomus cerebriforme TaxID=658196 RepID=A0A397SSQ0_9GLOM|nr:hypothetical protein C1645_776161 [Glomus cerebriforme]